MGRFFIKKVKHYNFSKLRENNYQQIDNEIINVEVNEIEEVKNEDINEIIDDVEQNNEEVMDTKEKIELANEILSNDTKVKKVKKEKGLIERTESSITILTEDNRELLKD